MSVLPGHFSELLFAAGALNETLFDRTAGTNIGDMTANAGLAAAFDGTTNQASASSAGKTVSTSAYVGKTHVDPKLPSRAVVYGSNNNGYFGGSNPTITLTLYGKNGAAPANATDGTLIGTLASFTDTADESGTPREIPCTDTETYWDHNWVRIQSSSSGTIICSEVILYVWE